MALMKIAGVKAYVSKGKTYAYHRASGERIGAPYGSSAFLEKLAALNAKQAPPPEVPAPGTWGDLVMLYRASPKFQKELARRTVEDYAKIFDWLKPLHGMALDDWKRPFVVQLRDKAHKQKGFHFANYVVAVVGSVFTWGVDRGHAMVHPIYKIKKLKRPKGLARANRPWTKAEWDVVTAAAMPHLLAPILLAGVLGWRECEVIGRPRGDYDRETRRIKRISAKSGKEVKTPVPVRLSEALDALFPHDGVTLLVSSKGSPWTAGGLSASFSRFIGDLEKLGVVDRGLTFHGARHMMATRAREMGFDKDTIADILGQSEAGMAEWYAREAALEQKLTVVMNEIERRTG